MTTATSLIPSVSPHPAAASRPRGSPKARPPTSRAAWFDLRRLRVLLPGTIFYARRRGRTLRGSWSRSRFALRHPHAHRRPQHFDPCGERPPAAVRSTLLPMVPRRIRSMPDASRCRQRCRHCRCIFIADFVVGHGESAAIRRVLMSRLSNSAVLALTESPHLVPGATIDAAATRRPAAVAAPGSFQWWRPAAGALISRSSPPCCRR
jgi:hypothetical protein